MKVGVIVNTTEIADWQFDVLEKLENIEGVKIKLFLICKSDTSIKRKNIFENLVFRIWMRRVIKGLNKKKNISKLNIEGVKMRETIVEAVGRFRHRFSPTDIEYIKAQNIDLLIRFGLNILTGEILTCCQHGVWSFHHGDEREYRGKPAAFWELFQRKKIVGGILQQLSEHLDGGKVLFRWEVSTIGKTWPEVLHDLRMVGTLAPVIAMRRLQGGAKNMAAEIDRRALGPIYKEPGNLSMFVFFVRRMVGRFRFGLSRAFVDHWQIGVTDWHINNDGNVALNKNIEIIEPGNLKVGFYADPFFLGDDIICEYYNGTVGAIRILHSENGRFEAFTELSEINGQHTSFPSVVNIGDKVFICPETKRKGEVCIYEISSNYNVQNKIPIIKEPLVDPNIHYKKNLFFLFGTDCNGFLKLYFSDSLEGGWVEHPNSPISTDLRFSRSAGRVQEIGGKFYRLAQDCSKEYGMCVHLFEISNLSKRDYSESFSQTIDPKQFGSRYRGLHTIDFRQGRVVLDLKTKKLRRDLIGKLFHKIYS